ARFSEAADRSGQARSLSRLVTDNSTCTVLAVTGAVADTAAILFPAPATGCGLAGGIQGTVPVTLAISSTVVSASIAAVIATSVATSITARVSTGVAASVTTGITTTVCIRRRYGTAGVRIDATRAHAFGAQVSCDLPNRRVGIGIAAVVHQDHLTVLQWVHRARDSAGTCTVPILRIHIPGNCPQTEPLSCVLN